MPRNRTETLSFKVEREFEQRLVAGAAATKLTKSALAIAAVDAALTAIERNGGRLVLPIRFTIADIPVSIDGPEFSGSEVRRLRDLLASLDVERSSAAGPELPAPTPDEGADSPPPPAHDLPAHGTSRTPARGATRQRSPGHAQ